MAETHSSFPIPPRIADDPGRFPGQRILASCAAALLTFVTLAAGAPPQRKPFTPVLAAAAPARARTLFLLAGTPTIYSPRGFPAWLYSVAGGRLAPVRQIADGLFSVASDLAGHLYVLNLGQTALSVIHEDAPEEVDVVPAPPVGRGRTARFSFFDPTWGAIAGPGVPPGVVFAGATSYWTITRVLAKAPSGSPRIVAGSWDVYRYFRYDGNGGGPFQQVVPAGPIVGSEICMLRGRVPGSCLSALQSTPPFLPAEAGANTATYEDSAGKHTATFRGVAIVADTAGFFAFNAPMPNTKLMSPRTVYLLNKATGRWSVLKLPFYDLWPRLFGAWLETTVQEPNPEGRASPGLENERADEVDVDTPAGVVWELPRVRGMYPANVYMPGRLLLQNLDDGRKLSIDTGQQDSEVLDVRSDGLILYRVNDEIFSAQIEGDKLSAPTLVVKGEDVPEVHWAFWSNAPAEPAPKGKQSGRK